MKIKRHTYGYRYFDENVCFEFGSRIPELYDVIKKQNAEWILIEYYADRSGIQESEKAHNGFFVTKTWANKKDYEKLY